MNFILIAGNPGSGKSWLASQMQEEFGGFIIDDPKSIACLEKIPSDCTMVYITDPNFCRTNVRERAEIAILGRFPGAKIEWIFFENNPEQCCKNTVGRKDDRMCGPDIRSYAKAYKIPPGSIIVGCYAPCTQQS